MGSKIGGFLKSFFDIKFWKFILVGIVNTLVGNGLQFLFFNLFHWNEWISSLLGYIIGSIMSYFLNKYFTFKNQEKGWKPVFKFALNIAICYTLAYIIAIPLIKWLCVANQWTMFGWSIDKFAGNLSMLVGACLFVAFNYIGQRFFAFKEKKEPKENSEKG
jgi:putative flippase GtrA